MKSFGIILALTAASSAIDIRAFLESHCRDVGRTVSWVGVQPDRCYATGGVSWSYGFFAIPTNWRLSTRSHVSGGCGPILHVFDSNGADFVCHGGEVNNVEYTGAGYSFINKKRSTDIAVENQECETPDTLNMEDGLTYRLKGLEESTWKSMVCSPRRKSSCSMLTDL